MDPRPVIRYRNTWKAYKRPVLTGVNLEVREGEMFALFGPSGTGKSVLLKTTLGLVVPDRGDVEVNGTSVFFGGKEAKNIVRRQVGYVFQQAALFDSLNVYRNVETGMPMDRLRRMGTMGAAREIWRALELVNLDPAEVMSVFPAELSGGMKKRVGIARAIVGRPRILLWDEPTTGLDPVNTAAVERLIKGLAEELSVTSVLVTHDVESALWMCDRVAMLEGGRIRFCGTPGEFQTESDPVVRAFVDRAAAQAALDVVEMT